MRLKDKVALITGAGSGIGRAAALLLASEGARVGALDTDADDLDEVVREIRGAGGEAVPLVADVSRPEEVREAVRRVAEEWNRLDIVFANAGVNGVWAPLEELEPDDWDKTLDVNLKGTFLTVKYAVPHLRRRGGSVVITSSVNGTRMFSNTGATAYSCSKAAQVAFTKMVALELAPPPRSGERHLSGRHRDQHPGEHRAAQPGTGTDPRRVPGDEQAAGAR